MRRVIVVTARGWMGAAACVLALSACNGWPRTAPYAEAEHRPEKYPTYMAASAEAVPEFTLGGHRYMVMPAAAQPRSAASQSVGGGGGVSVFAAPSDQAPFSSLYAQQNGQWRAVGLID